MDVSLSYGTLFCLYNEEVFEGFCTVCFRCEVGEVVSELHGLVVHSVCPASEHGYFGCGVGAQCVAVVKEVVETYGYVGFCGVEILRNTCAK